MLRTGHWPGTLSSFPDPHSAAPILSPRSPAPEPSPGLRGGAAIRKEQITRARGSCLPDVLGAVPCSCHSSLCLAQHLAPKTHGPCAWPPSRDGMWGALRGQGPAKAKGQACWGAQNGSTAGQCLAALPGPWPNHGWSSVGDNPGSLDIQPGLFLHRSLDRGTKMALGDSTGGPQRSMVPARLQRRVLELSSRRAPVPTRALPWLLVSPDRVPHGHGPAQRGQHLVPVRGAHATGRRPNDDMAYVVPTAITAALSYRHTERQVLGRK